MPELGRPGHLERPALMGPPERCPYLTSAQRKWSRHCDTSDGCEVTVMETRLRTRRNDSQKETAAFQSQIVTRATAKKAQDAGIDPELLPGEKTPPVAKAASPTRRGSSQKTKLSTKRQRDNRSGTPKRVKEAKRASTSAAKSGDNRPSVNKASAVDAGPSAGRDVHEDPKPGQQPDRALSMDRRQRASGDGSRDKDANAEDVSRAMSPSCRFCPFVFPASCSDLPAHEALYL